LGGGGGKEVSYTAKVDNSSIILKHERERETNNNSNHKNKTTTEGMRNEMKVHL
jgi:hypothetical protein